jgi:hypothetical protein
MTCVTVGVTLALGCTFQFYDEKLREPQALLVIPGERSETRDPGPHDGRMAAAFGSRSRLARGNAYCARQQRPRPALGRDDSGE